MFSNKFNNYCKRLYTDKFTILRYIDIENEDGSLEETLDKNPILKDIPCKISKVTLDEHKDSDSVNKELVKFKIFCSPKIDVKKGDTIIANRYLDDSIIDTIKAISSRPIKYNINQEFILIEKDEA
ncbi:hypothetical protein [Clostridium chrysemydis]|uniref:hypothetical protein n=1 Tax=Clostridium chrysemydis TaxID=2665504 RepID=UPI001883A9B1|nr:hypothetical protein [Clostridium chrysemydis]